MTWLLRGDGVVDELFQSNATSFGSVTISRTCHASNKQVTQPTLPFFGFLWRCCYDFIDCCVPDRIMISCNSSSGALLDGCSPIAASNNNHQPDQQQQQLYDHLLRTIAISIQAACMLVALLLAFLVFRYRKYKVNDTHTRQEVDRSICSRRFHIFVVDHHRRSRITFSCVMQ